MTKTKMKRGCFAAGRRRGRNQFVRAHARARVISRWDTFGTDGRTWWAYVSLPV